MMIDQNIPLPSKYHGKHTDVYRQMRIGDSVFIANSNFNTSSVVASRRAAKRWGWGFTSKLEGNGVRIWRIA